MKKKNIYNIKKKIFFFYITGNDILKKQKCKIILKKKIKKETKNINIINFLIIKKFEWKKITHSIINKNFISKKKLIILNFIEKINNIEKYIHKYIYKYIKKNEKNIYIIFLYEIYKKINKNFILKKNNSLIINCYYKNKKNIINPIEKNIKKLIKSFKKKNIIKCLNNIKKIKNNKTNKIYLINIIFNYISKNLNEYKYEKKIKILEIIKKIEIKNKKYLNIEWKKIYILCIYIIKYKQNK